MIMKNQFGCCNWFHVRDLFWLKMVWCKKKYVYVI